MSNSPSFTDYLKNAAAPNPPASPGQAPSFSDYLAKQSASADAGATAPPGPSGDGSLVGAAVGAARRFGSDFAKNLLPSTHLPDYWQGPLYAVEHPLDSAKLIGGGIYDTQAKQFKQAEQAWRTGGAAGKIAAAVRAASGLVPLVGPAAEQAGEQIGSGDVAGGLGSAAGLLTGLAAGTKTGRKVTSAALSLPLSVPGRVAAAFAPMSDAMKLVSPGERFSPGEIKQFADAKAIPLNAAEITQHPALQQLETAGRRSIPGAGAIVAHKAEAYGGLGTAYSDFLDKLAPPDSHTQLLKSLGPERTTAEAGAAMQDDLGKALDTAKASAKADYATWREKTGDVPVDLSPVGEKWAGKFAETRDALKKMPWEYAGPVWKLLKKAASLGGPDLPETVRVGGEDVPVNQLPQSVQDRLRAQVSADSMDTAQQLRSAYLDMASDRSGVVPNRVQAMARQIAGDIDGAMSAAAENAPGGEAAFRAANAKWRDLQQTFNNPKHPFNQALRAEDPAEVIPKLAAGEGSVKVGQDLQRFGVDTSALKRELVAKSLERSDKGVFETKNLDKALGRYAPEFLESLFAPDEAEALRSVQRRAVAESLVDRFGSGLPNFKTLNGRLGALSADKLASLYAPEEIAELQKYGRIGSAVGNVIDPSGTAAGLGAMGDVQAAGSGKVGKLMLKYVAAKLSNADWFNNWMTRQPGTFARVVRESGKGVVTPGRVAAAVAGQRLASGVQGAGQYQGR